MIHFFAGLYILTLMGLAVYGCLGFFTLVLYGRHRHDTCPTPPEPTVWPLVTVQLPIFNERGVVERLIAGAVALDYPVDRLQIQILDDSTDDTSQRARQLVQKYQEKGIHHLTFLHRNNRQGYKAGALAEGMAQATGEFIAIFDADFCPPADFLRQTIPHFSDAPRLGMVQTRWGHLNQAESALTAVQAIALDKHFAVEQAVRYRANLFPKFNGSAGVWRRTCLEQAGGWQEDTVCEDLCLSTRAVLQGWEFRFLPHIVAPAELPATVLAYKSQQARWSKGSLQCLRKFGAEIVRDGRQTGLARLYALLSMSAYITQPLVLLLLLLQVPLIAVRYPFPPSLILLSLAGLGQPLLFILAQQCLYPDWMRRLRHLPAMLVIAIGLAVGNSRALWQVWFGQEHPFIRTPKGRAYNLPFDKGAFLELALAVYALMGMGIAIAMQQWGQIAFLAVCALGLGYVGCYTLWETGWHWKRPLTTHETQNLIHKPKKNHVA